MLVFKIKQVNLYDVFWINCKYDFSKYLSHEYTGYVLISIAFLASHSSMKGAFIKQKLNSGTFLHNQWRKVGYANETIHAAWWLNQTDRLFLPHDTLFVHQLGILIISCLSCCHPPCVASVGIRKIHHPPYNIVSQFLLLINKKHYSDYTQAMIAQQHICIKLIYLIHPIVSYVKTRTP